MNKLNKVTAVILFNVILSACGGGSGDSGPDVIANPSAASCDKVFASEDVYIVDLSQNSTSGVACTMTSDREEIADCVEERIRAEFADSPACLNAFDIFVPGTNQEDGAYSQFTKIISPLPERTYLSVQYSDEATLIDDAIQYDKGVTEASNALEDLLYTLKTRFSSPQVRAFGHSKGSDAVARVSAKSGYEDKQFFAFAQAGRTPSAVRGTPGYIEKLADNLVAITWQNDEVKFYSGGSGGYQTPEIWGFPGYVNQAGGGLSTIPIRIDHHNNYGGKFTKRDYPYCATGNKAAMVTTAECKKQDGVRYLPYFWGDAECTEKAYEIMDAGAKGTKYYIGYSGPRAPGCKDTAGTIEVDYELVYRMNLGDQGDCKSVVQLSFDGLDFGATRADGGKLTFSSTKDTGWITKRGKLQLPYHINLSLWTYLAEAPNTIGSCASIAKSEIYVDKLKVTFDHPETNSSITRTLIGLAEGIEYFWPSLITNKNNVAWRKDKGTWDLHYGIPPLDPTHGGAIMAKGVTDGGRGGVFYKWVHLLD